MAPVQREVNSRSDRLNGLRADYKYDALNRLDRHNFYLYPEFMCGKSRKAVCPYCIDPRRKGKNQSVPIHLLKKC